MRAKISVNNYILPSGVYYEIRYNEDRYLITFATNKETGRCQMKLTDFQKNAFYEYTPRFEKKIYSLNTWKNFKDLIREIKASM